MKAISIQERVRNLVNTSVQDMQSSLPYYSYLSAADIAAIHEAMNICQKRGEKTKATILRRKHRKMQADLRKARALFAKRS